MFNSLNLYDKLYRVKFTNATKFPIVVESWVHKLDGLSTMKETIVEPFETIDVYSVTGEWYLHNMLTNQSDFAIWKNNGFKFAGRVGKFRLDTDIGGNFAWFNEEGFSIKKQNDEFVFVNN